MKYEEHKERYTFSINFASSQNNNMMKLDGLQQRTIDQYASAREVVCDLDH